MGNFLVQTVLNGLSQYVILLRVYFLLPYLFLWTFTLQNISPPVISEPLL